MRFIPTDELFLIGGELNLGCGDFAFKFFCSAAEVFDFGLNLGDSCLESFDGVFEVFDFEWQFAAQGADSVDF